MQANVLTAEKMFLKALGQLPADLSKIVIGLSGGADSTVLAHLISRFSRLLPRGCRLEAVYVHHGLSEHAEEWAEFCSDLAVKLHLPFSCEHVHLSLKPGVSVEAEARTCRYKALSGHFVSGTCVLATAHHANDEAETFLLALKRGAGLPGLAAMGVLQNFSGGYIWRPLLKITRADIEEYANFWKLSYVTDESNGDVTYDRNFLRHEIIPLLCNRFPAFLEMVGLSAGFAAEAQELIEEVGNSDLISCQNDNNSLNILKLLEQSLPRRKNVMRLFFRSKAGFYPGRELLESVFNEIIPAGRDASPCSSSQGWSVRRFRNNLYVVDNSSLDHPQEIQLALNSVFSILGESWVLCKSSGPGFAELPVCLDFTQSFSTVLHPVGRNHSRSMKKLFGEYGIPPWMRHSIPVVKNREGKIIGLFPDHYEKDSFTSTEGYVLVRAGSCE